MRIYGDSHYDFSHKINCPQHRMLRAALKGESVAFQNVCFICFQATSGAFCQNKIRSQEFFSVGQQVLR